MFITRGVKRKNKAIQAEKYRRGSCMFRIESISQNSISPDMLLNFHHYQIIHQKYMNINGGWKITKTQELREWNVEKRIWITKYLCEQITHGGSVVGAFFDDVLIGFCSVDGYLCGETAKYANLTMLFVDDEFKRKGVGKALFKAASKCALVQGADKLFISAIPSVETIAFYFNMGCTDAKEIITNYIDTENDRYLEYKLR